MTPRRLRTCDRCGWGVPGRARECAICGAPVAASGSLSVAVAVLFAVGLLSLIAIFTRP